MAAITRPRLVALLVGASLAVAACAQFEAADDLGGLQFVTSREAGTITAYSTTWNAPESLILLCPSEPTETQEGLADAGTLHLDPACQRYGPFETARGIDLALGLGEIDAGRRGAFDAAPEWWIVVIGVEEGSARGIYKTVVRGGPIDPAVTPGPSPSPAPSPEPAGSAAP